MPQNMSATMLDIGSGTGVLALMAAQLNPAATIHAVEIHPGACTDAQRNFQESTFPLPPKLFQSDVRIYQYSATPKSYHVIFSNPPFYTNQLEPISEGKKISKHDSKLSFYELAEVVGRLLHPEGAFYVLLPPDRMRLLEHQLLQIGLHSQHRIEIEKQKEGTLFREIVRFGYVRKTLSIRNIRIYDHAQTYSAEFRSYLAPFYLNL